MKSLIEYILTRQPKIYEAILRFRKNYNFEKVVFINLVRNGDVVFDVGANRGYYTLLFSYLVGKFGEVHAFEPVPPTFKKLSQEVFKNKRFDNVYLNNTAVGDINGVINLYMPDNDDGQSSMKTHKSGSWQNTTNITTYNCEVIKLDDYASSRVRDSLDFIKCDVEGAELLVLKGFNKTITKYLPIIYLEVCDDWTRDFNYSPVAIVKLLVSLGYVNFYLISNNIRLLSNPITELSKEYFSGSANLLCVIPKLHSHKIEWLLNQ